MGEFNAKEYVNDIIAMVNEMDDIGRNIDGLTLQVNQHAFGFQRVASENECDGCVFAKNIIYQLFRFVRDKKEYGFYNFRKEGHLIYFRQKETEHISKFTYGEIEQVEMVEDEERKTSDTPYMTYFKWEVVKDV